MNSAILIYIPVIHQGYLRLLAKYPEAEILLPSPELMSEFKSLRKDIRALDPMVVAALLKQYLPNQQITVINAAELQQRSFETLIVPEDEVLAQLLKKYLPEQKVSWEKVFLRWDSDHSLTRENPEPSSKISTQEFDQKMMGLAVNESDQSPDWWRQVGAVLVRDGQVLLTAHNHYVPDNQQAYYDGDPRANFQKGLYIELGLAMHAEAEIITKAAAQGLATAGAELYVTTFPCPACSKLIAYSGIKKLYFKEGYSLVHGSELLQSQGIELIKVA